MSKTIVITGATRGIGKAIVDHFVADASVDRLLLISKTPPTVRDTDRRLIHHSCDLSTNEGIESAIAFVRASAPAVNLLVNNAGAISGGESFAEVSHAAFLSSFTLHAASHFLLARAMNPLFPIGDNNLIVNIGSIYGNLPDPYAVAYVAAKSAVPIITQLLAKELAPRVRVNSIAPGHFDTEMTRAAPPEYVNDVISKTPMKRLGHPNEIAQMVEFLWSPAGQFITGSHFRSDGGFWATVP